jgi:glycogen synthase
MGGTLLWLTQHYFPQQGGMAQSCDRIVGGLRRRGWRIDLVHCSRRWPALQAQRRLNGHDIRCPVEDDISHSLNRLWCALPQMTGTQYDAVVAFGGMLPMLAGPVFAAWRQRPLITLIRGNDFDAAVFDPKRMDILGRALRTSSNVAAVSQDKVEKIERLWPEVSATWIANGIDLESWQAIAADAQQADELRQQMLGGEPRLLLGLFGHIKPKKGADYLLDGLLRSGRAAQVHLLIVGEVDPAFLARLQPEEGDDPPFSYTHIPFGDRYALLPMYLACDYVCIPSYYDGMPNVMLEAAALGVPLLASRVGGMADVLEDGRHGFLFEPGDVDGCAMAIGRCFATPESEYAALAEACRVLARERLSLETELDRYEELFSIGQGAAQKGAHLKLI